MSEEKKEMAAVQPAVKDITLGTNIFSGFREFQVAQRMAQALASSTIIPKDYQDNIGNCIIALEMANRLHTSPMMVMQNLYIVNGRPAWSSQYIIAMINASRKYRTELQFEMKGSGNSLECTAFAEDRTGHKVKGPTITMAMAEKEGWATRSGSKWKTMPEVMIRYRAASFFGRLNCPDMIMGIYSTDEVIEMSPDQYHTVDTEVQQEQAQQPIDIQVDRKTGEVKEPVKPKDDEKPKQQKEAAQTAQPEQATSQQAFEPGF